MDQSQHWVESITETPADERVVMRTPKWKTFSSPRYICISWQECDVSGPGKPLELGHTKMLLDKSPPTYWIISLSRYRVIYFSTFVPRSSMQPLLKYQNDVTHIYLWYTLYIIYMVWNAWYFVPILVMYLMNNRYWQKQKYPLPTWTQHFHLGKIVVK